VIANQIKELRESLGLKPAQFAASLNEKLQRVQDIERGKQRVPEDLLIKIVEIFHVSGHWLITGQGDMYGSKTDANRNIVRAAIEELQAWQMRGQRFLPPEKFAEAVFTLCELAEDKPERVKPAAAVVLRLVA
jgi:transcriptional regulator with XRE-family HTH domain